MRDGRVCLGYEISRAELKNQAIMKSSFLAFLSILLASANAFSTPAAILSKPPLRPAPTTVAHLRGGNAQASLASVLAGTMALPATAAISAVAGSLAYIHQAYIFSLSYGLSMLGIGGAVLLTAPASRLLVVHAGLVAAYGLRLFAFLFWRQKLQPGYDGTERLKALDKTPPLKRTPIILSTAIFYSLMSSPIVFHAQAAPLVGAAASVSAVGSALAAVGLLVEAVADQQKSLFKMKLRADGKDDELYMGGVYAKSRHANYAGEVLFWMGSFVAGLPAISVPGVTLLTRAARFVASGLGLAGIVFIMLSATKRLEGKQAEKYGSSAWYTQYVGSSGSLVPKL